ncbi:MAG: glycosyltransferase family 2 protein [Schwartzia sp.]|nr:glycosyltransferase family 2 protein [Schwartzia sp. (in: firmicutes)]
MRLSVCYIVRDEAAKLEKSLASLEDAADEIVVVDTGSADDTVRIAEAHGARVFSFPWRDDFSAARNASLARATGDWILVVDADEYFPDGMAKNIRRVIERYGKDADLLLFTRRELDEDAGKVLLDSYVPRLLRRVDGLFYEGAIHEEPRHHGESIRRVAVVPGEELLLMHTGYSATLSQAKGERNLALLRKELDSGHPRNSIYMYLAETYDGLGDEDSAMKYAWLDVESGRKPFAFASRSYRILLRILSKRPELFRERRKAARMAARDFPELPEFHGEYAECLGFGLDYRGALTECRKALAIYAKGVGGGLEPTTFDAATAALIEERSALWARRVRDEKLEKPLRALASAGDWQGLLRETRRSVWDEGVKLFSLLLLMEGDASEEARSASSLAEVLLPSGIAAVWRGYTGVAALNGEMRATCADMIDEVKKIAGTERAARLSAVFAEAAEHG